MKNSQLHPDDLLALYTHLLSLKDEKGAPQLDQEAILKYKEDFTGFDCEDSEEVDNLAELSDSKDLTYVASKHNKYAILIPRKNFSCASQNGWLQHYELQSSYNVVFQKVGRKPMKVGERKIILASRRPPLRIYDSFEDNRNRLQIDHSSTISSLRSWNYAIYLEVIDSEPIPRLTPLLLGTQQRSEIDAHNDPDIIDLDAESVAENIQWQLTDFTQNFGRWKSIRGKDTVIVDLENSESCEKEDESLNELTLEEILSSQDDRYSLEPEEAYRRSKLNDMKHEVVSEAEKVLVVNALSKHDENPHWFQPIDGDRKINSDCIQRRIFNHINCIKDDESTLSKVAEKQSGSWTCNVGVSLHREAENQDRKCVPKGISFEQDAKNSKRGKLTFPRLRMADIFVNATDV